MESGSNRDRHRTEDQQLARAIDDLVPPLTTIHGYAQLLQRRIRMRGTPSNEELLEALETIERASRALEGRLRQLESEVENREK